MVEGERFQMVDRLLDAALELEPGERASYLDRECPDRRVRAEVERLLGHVDTADDFLRPGGALGGPLARALAEELERDELLPEGTQLGQYSIRGLLGAGGMGAVYRAYDPVLERDVAIKVLPEAFASDPERLQRLRREARVLASLNHPNIASIYGIQEAGGVPFLVLELIEGEMLAERLARGPLSLGKAVEIALQIAEALEEAHGKGVVHRDLKPATSSWGPTTRCSPSCAADGSSWCRSIWARSSRAVRRVR